MSRFLALAFCLVLAAGCTPRTSYPLLHESDPLRQRVAEESRAGFSLFSDPSAGIEEAAIAHLLASRVEIPADARLAVLQVPGRSRTHLYGFASLTEDELQTREAYLDTLRARLAPGGVREVEFLPSLLVPAQPSIPVLREVAVRLQADALLVLRLQGDLFRNDRLFGSDRLKAYATCEAVLLDVRTGALPFTSIVTRDLLTEQQDRDLTDAEAQRRAEQQAALLALTAMADELANFLRSR